MNQSAESKYKLVEIMMFIDPISVGCWCLEPVIKRLTIEYGEYFQLRHVIAASLSSMNITSAKDHAKLAELWEASAKKYGMSCDGSIWMKNPITSTHLTSRAIIAAQIQGRQLGKRFVRKVYESLFIFNIDISKYENLLNIAKEINLDLDEFSNDLFSNVTEKALQGDLKNFAEHNVGYTPKIVMYHNRIIDEGLVLEGIYSYSVYEQMLVHRLGFEPVKADPPPLEEFLKYDLVATREICEVYDFTYEEATTKMNKLLNENKVEKIEAKYGDFWRSIESR